MTAAGDALDWLVRVHAPAWLDLAGLTGEAAALRAPSGDTLPAVATALQAAALARNALRPAAARFASWEAREASDHAWMFAGDAADGAMRATGATALSGAVQAGAPHEWWQMCVGSVVTVARDAAWVVQMTTGDLGLRRAVRDLAAPRHLFEACQR